MRRREFVAASALVLGAPPWLRRRSRPLPSPAQLAWQRAELALFVHFGINTFTDREWGDGTEDPGLFDPPALDARQWARAARAGGFRTMVLTAKHHDGFCLWPTRTTRHSVASSPWRGGEGNLVREFADACRAEGLGVGLYLSPWDRHEPSYGDSPRYNDLYCDQLTELLTGYGPLVEVWFDGANGEGPNGRRQVYDWPRYHGLIRRHQPDALIFSDAGPDIRWIGNERGEAGDPNWCTVDPAAVPFPGAEGEAVIAMLQHGDPEGAVWRPGEADVSIRPGWFWHPAEDARVRTGAQLMDLYFSSVGRNANLLLNVPPTRAGLLHETDVRALAEFGSRRASLHGSDVAGGAATWSGPASLELQLIRPSAFDVVSIGEAIEQGQRVAAWGFDAWDGSRWRELARGSTIGQRRLVRVPLTETDRVRLRVEETLDPPLIASLLLLRERG